MVEVLAEREVVERVEAALEIVVSLWANYREAATTMRWYRANTRTRLRWIVHRDDWDDELEPQWARRDPMPEGYFYALDYLPTQHSLSLTHSNQKVGPVEWTSAALSSATLIHLEWVLVAERMNRKDGELGSLLAHLFERYPPNLYSKT